jgi:hypothetical protein
MTITPLVSRSMRWTIKSFSRRSVQSISKSDKLCPRRCGTATSPWGLSMARISSSSYKMSVMGQHVRSDKASLRASLSP